MTDPEGVIEYNAKYSFLPYRLMNNCMWNITVRQGRTIKFEFIELNISNDSSLGTSTVTIRNGIDDSSPLLGEGQFQGSQIPKDIPVTSSNRAFVKYKSFFHILNTFKIRYSEVQHECGGQTRLSLNSNSYKLISTPNYPNMPSPHIECTWMIIAPIGEKVRIDFLERFDVYSLKECDKQYVELRDGLTSASQLIGTFCRDKPTTKYSKSNILMIKYFNDISEPGNGFKANVSIGICGGFRKSRMGYLTSPKYPGLGAYPSNANCDYRISGPSKIVFNVTFNEIDLPEKNETFCDLTKDHIKIFSVFPQFSANGSDLLIEEGTFCGNDMENSSIISSSSEISIQFNTFKKSKNVFKGFKLFYNASSTSCGGSVEGDSGVISSPGYPSKTLSKSVCQWKITVPKGKRVKIEFEDVDFIKTRSAFMQRIGIYNDFIYSSRMKFISNDTIPEPMYSSDNKMMIVMWIRIPSSNRGFKLKFSSEDTTICSGNLNADSGGWSSPTDANLTSYSCEFVRDNKAIIPTLPNVGTISYLFKNIAAGKKIPNCRYASTVINVKRRSGKIDNENTLARICGNETVSQTVLSPFADVTIEVRKSPYFGQLNYTMEYKTHKCGGLISGGGESFITNPPKFASNEKILDCAWFGRFSDGYSVSINFEKLNLSLPCEKEYIQIFNGPTALSPTIGKFCGTANTMEKIVSESNTVYIEYHTDNFVENSKDSVFEIKLTESSFGCGGILNKGITSFKTPLYDKSYPPNTECIWEIRGGPGYHIGLTFIDRFFIESSPNCTKDYIEVFDFVDDDWKSLGKKCGRDVPKPFNSTSDKMKVIFRSDESTNGDGFSAVWNQNCGGIIEVTPKMQILSSPGFPKNYGPGLLCNYTLKAPSLKSFINFNFLEFNIETTGTKCLYDNITIFKRYDYATEHTYYDPEKVGTYCGLNNPGKFRHRGVSYLIFRSDRWVERKGFQIEYKLDECGGDVSESSLIESPEIDIPTTGYFYLGTLYCTWNITAPADKKIVIKFNSFYTEHSEYCSFDYVDIFNGSLINDTARLAKICGNLTTTLKPIVIDNNKALIQFKTDQTNQYGRFSAAIMFKPKCDEIIELTEKQKSYTLDKTNRVFNESMECIFKVRAEPLSSIKVTFNQLHLSICDPDQNPNKDECDCNYLELLDGNGPFSESIKKVCGHDLPLNVISSHSALYIRFVTSGVRVSTGFSLTFTMIQSPCGPVPHLNFTVNSTEAIYLTSPVKSSDSTYPPNLRCMWIAEAPYGKIFDIRFTKFELEDSENCANDTLTLEDNSLKESIPEGLGEEIVYRGKSRQVLTPSFYSGVSGPIAPHVYCGSEIPHDYISQTNKIKILFETDSLHEFSGFNLSISTADSCSRNFTGLQGRLVSTDTPVNCKTTIKVPDNFTITLYFHRFYFYESDCGKAFLKIYEGSFEDGVLMKTFCGYATPDPIFSVGNQLSLIFNYGDESSSFSRGSYDIMYLATDKGQGCGGEVFNYGGVFTSPLYPYNAATNRTSYDCTWTIKVPQNLKVAVRFASKLFFL